MTRPEPLRLALLAPTCDGEDVGEAWLTYQWVRRLVARHRVTLLTYHKRGRGPAAEQLPGARVIEWQDPPLVGRAERLNSMLKPGYVPYYLRARRWLRSALAAGERFDLIHQLAPEALRYPSPAQGLGVPYLIGPVGGGLESPPRFRAEETDAPWFVGLRRIDSWRLRHDGRLRRTYQDADCVLGIADYVAESLSPLGIRRFEVMGDTGLDGLPELGDTGFDRTRPGDGGPDGERRDRSGPVRLLFVGRVIRTKGVRDAVRAMSLVRDPEVLLDVVGDGFDRPRCEQLVQELGLTARVAFHGRQPRAEVDGFYRRADVFLFPSYREPGGIVVAEAMGFALPLIVCARGGPASTVDDGCGIRVPADTPEQYARDLAAAIDRLVAEPELRRSMGRAARERIREIGLWDLKVERLEALYQSVLAGHRIRTT